MPQPSALPASHTPSTAPASPAGPLHSVRQLRRQQHISQLALSLQVGVSQRHLSCIETGRARPSRQMLHALLQANRGTVAMMGLLGVPAQREAVHSPALRAQVDALRPLLPRRLAGPCPERPVTPLLETVLRTTAGDVLRFLSAFTTFGAPLDVTAASLRVEHFFPADAATRERMAQAVAALPA